MPVRISGVTLPEKKRMAVALTRIFGIGRSLSARILNELKISTELRPRDLTAAQEKLLRDYIEQKLSVEGDLKRMVAHHIKHLKDVGCYRGKRHTLHLPVRGQRTRTNTRTVRGNVRHTAGSGRKAAAAKT